MPLLKHCRFKNLALPFIGLVRVYQWTIGLALPPRCRFYPTCSDYALQAVKQFPLHCALFLILKRLLKCHAFHPGGVDLLPPSTRTFE